MTGTATVSRLPGDRLTRILAALETTEGTDGSDGAAIVRICRASVMLAAVSGVAAAVMNDPQRHETVCASDDVAGSLVELEFSLGEGPGMDAHRTGRPVLEEDLAQSRASRWAAFTDGALASGARAVFAFPLQMGAISLGTLLLYRREPGGLDSGRMSDVLVLARIATQSVLALQAQSPLGNLHPGLAAASPNRIVVHQATGMVAAQLGVGIGEAFVRLQGHAYVEDRPLNDVAAEVVSRRLRFDDRT